jgi:hypothetical protein
MVKCGVLFEVRTEFLNNIQTSFGFKRLIDKSFVQYKYQDITAVSKAIVLFLPPE